MSRSLFKNVIWLFVFLCVTLGHCCVLGERKDACCRSDVLHIASAADRCACESCCACCGLAIHKNESTQYTPALSGPISPFDLFDAGTARDAFHQAVSLAVSASESPPLSPPQENLSFSCARRPPPLS
ncbi:MAG: hypothetical protein IT210_06955 [Armatimonadetes bacterium]|nr:hypothetical protein [Armatimonadota bacterium]